MKRRPKIRPTVLARWLSWSGRALSAANRPYRGRGDVLIARPALHLYLFNHATAAGLIPEPVGMIDRPHSAYVAEWFRDDPEAVKAEARRYWRALTKERDPS